MASTMLLASRSTRRLLSRPALRLGAPPPPLWNVGRVRHLSPSYKDPYSVLGVSRGASKDEIKAAYLQLAKKWHPDRNPQRRQQAEAKFKEISEAYSSLSSGPGSSRVRRSAAAAGARSGGSTQRALAIHPLRFCCRGPTSPASPTRGSLAQGARGTCI
mmetsp:Transcript_4355/g.10851  ORF Transcript_4355/g.10851 Transcript_4355/m.10851 type:complete len:159 (+) Transcript_4355:10-486(+)